MFLWWTILFNGFTCWFDSWMPSCGADISALLAKSDDPKMGEDPGVAEVVRQLDQACREAGFFYVVYFIHLPICR